MDWIKRSLRAFALPASQRRRPIRLSFDALEDRAVPTAAGVISGSVFFDKNADNVKNGDDFVVPSANVNLTGTTEFGNAVNLTSFTTAAGAYSFQKLEPGTYQVSVTVPSGPAAIAELGNLGGTSAGNQAQSVSLSQGQTEVNLNFAFPGTNNTAVDPNAISLRLFLNDNIGDPTKGTSNKIVTLIADTSASDFKSKFVDGVPPGTGRTLADSLINTTIPAGTASLAGDVFQDGTTTPAAGVSIRLTGVNKTGVPIVLNTTTDSSGHYSFTGLTGADYFINVLPGASLRAGSATVGSLGGTATRSDQLAPSTLGEGATGAGYNFSLTSFAGDLDAALANDVGNGSLGTFTDGITSDPSIRGRLLNAGNFADLQAHFIAGATTSLVSVKASLATDGTFLLNEQTMRDVFGGGIPDGTYTVEIIATPTNGAALTKTVSFTLKTQGPSFLHAYGNISNTASAANTTLILAGGFADPNITNSIVTLKAFKGTTPVDINVELFDKDAPRTVANFFNYFDRYALSGGVLFHRLHLESGLRVLQGGGFNFNESTNTLNTAHITEDPAIINEFSQDRPNVRGTIAMAKTSDPNSATSEFFFNLDDADAQTLNINNGASGGFTVFGRLQSDADLAVVDDLASVPIKNTGQFNELPLVDGNTVDVNNLERIKQVATVHRDDELTYSVTSSNAAAVTATAGGFQGNQLTLDYLAAGTSTITVTATDKTGNTATTTFIVTVT